MSIKKIGDFDIRIAAAQEIYECLREAVALVCNHDGDCAQCVHDGVFDCAARKWVDALANAGGESEVAK